MSVRKLFPGHMPSQLLLFGVLRPGDELIYITGQPYDTLDEVIGIRGKGTGSLKEFGVSYNAFH